MPRDEEAELVRFITYHLYVREQMKPFEIETFFHGGQIANELETFRIEKNMII